MMKNNLLQWNVKLFLTGFAMSAIGMVCHTLLLAQSPQAAQVAEGEAKPTEPRQNLLLNGSLSEQEKKGGTIVPLHWEQGYDVEGVTYTYRREGSESDGASSYLEISKSAPRYFPIAAWHQTFDRTGDAPAIAIAAKVKAKSVTKAILDVVFLDVASKPISHKWIAYIGRKSPDGKPLDHDWKKYEGVAQIPEGCSKISVLLQDYGPGTVGFDDIEAYYEQDVSKVTDAVEQLNGATGTTFEGPATSNSKGAGNPLHSYDRMVYGVSGSIAPNASTPGNSSKVYFANPNQAFGVPPTAQSPEWYKEYSQLELNLIGARAEYLQAKDGEARETIRKNVTEWTAKQFDILRQQRLDEIARIEKELAAAKAKLEKRDQAKAKIVEKRVEQFIDSDPLYAWQPNNFAPQPLNSTLINHQGNAFGIVSPVINPVTGQAIPYTYRYNDPMMSYEGFRAGPQPTTQYGFPNSINPSGNPGETVYSGPGSGSGRVGWSAANSSFIPQTSYSTPNGKTNPVEPFTTGGSAPSISTIPIDPAAKLELQRKISELSSSIEALDAVLAEYPSDAPHRFSIKQSKELMERQLNEYRKGLGIAPNVESR